MVRLLVTEYVILKILFNTSYARVRFKWKKSDNKLFFNVTKQNAKLLDLASFLYYGFSDHNVFELVTSGNDLLTHLVILSFSLKPKWSKQQELLFIKL